MRRLMVAAPASGSGKTVLTCGLLAAFQARGVSTEAFKCGPDYIDPMFHQKVLGLPSRNLDLFLQGEQGVRHTLSGQQADLALIEGAMGYYDGLNGTDQASAWHTARTGDLPVILAVRPGGSSLTLAAQLKGLQDFRPESNLRGIVLTLCKPSLHAHLAPILTRETGLPVLGYLPPMAEGEITSRHLGLLTAGEITDLEQRFAAIARQLEKTVDLDALWSLAAQVPPRPAQPKPRTAPRCTIGVAWDEAFCFYYQDSLDALKNAGADLCFFSPLHDAGFPAVDGLYLGGGYPELYAAQLAQQATMRRAISAALGDGLPTVAECGGFLYLQTQLQTPEGEPFPMAAFLPGESHPTGSPAPEMSAPMISSGLKISFLMIPPMMAPAMFPVPINPSFILFFLLFSDTHIFTVNFCSSSRGISFVSIHSMEMKCPPFKPLRSLFISTSLP